MRLTLPELDTIRDNPEASPETADTGIVREPNRSCTRATSSSRNDRPGIVALCGDAHALTRLSRGRV
jgi:hypothetical protein